jgi:hypothetical protein
LCAQLQRLTALLGISRPLVRSSTLRIPADVHGQARVIAVARALGATCYVNSPGGHELYDSRDFADQGIELKFLAPFHGPQASILSLLLNRSMDEVVALIRGDGVLCS